ncbi:hypothetical protein AB6D11_02530 [Vibrio splendidus]
MTAPMIYITPEQLKQRLPDCIEMIRNRLNVGCSPSYAYDIAATIQGLKDHKTYKGLIEKGYLAMSEIDTRIIRDEQLNNWLAPFFSHADQEKLELSDAVCSAITDQMKALLSSLANVQTQKTTSFSHLGNEQWQFWFDLARECQEVRGDNPADISPETNNIEAKNLFKQYKGSISAVMNDQTLRRIINVSDSPARTLTIHQQLSNYVEKQTDEHACESGVDSQIGDLLALVDLLAEQLSPSKLAKLIRTDEFRETCTTHFHRSDLETIAQSRRIKSSVEIELRDALCKATFISLDAGQTFWRVDATEREHMRINNEASCVYLSSDDGFGDTKSYGFDTLVDLAKKNQVNIKSMTNIFG